MTTTAKRRWGADFRGEIDGISFTDKGKVIFDSAIGASSTHRVSPVAVFLRPMIAQMSPGPTSSTASRLFAWILTRRPMRS